jgi:hypothetical protein
LSVSTASSRPTSDVYRARDLVQQLGGGVLKSASIQAGNGAKGRKTTHPGKTLNGKPVIVESKVICSDSYNVTISKMVWRTVEDRELVILGAVLVVKQLREVLKTGQRP